MALQRCPDDVEARQVFMISDRCERTQARSCVGKNRGQLDTTRGILGHKIAGVDNEVRLQLIDYLGGSMTM